MENGRLFVCFKRLPLPAAGMSDLDDAVERFLRDAEKAYSEYEKGYTDADATLRVLRTHLDRLDAELEE